MRSAPAARFFRIDLQHTQDLHAVAMFQHDIGARQPAVDRDSIARKIDLAMAFGDAGHRDRLCDGRPRRHSQRGGILS